MFDSITHPGKRAFLAAYAECGSVRRCAELAGVHRSTHHDWMEHDPEYAAVFARVHKMAADALLDECVQRAQLGIEEYVVSGGQVVMVYEPDEDGNERGRALKRRKYSDSLLAMLVKARLPEYRDRVKTEHSGAVKIEQQAADVDLSALSDDDFADLKRLAQKANRLASSAGGAAEIHQAGSDVPDDGPVEA